MKKSERSEVTYPKVKCVGTGRKEHKKTNSGKPKATWNIASLAKILQKNNTT